MSCVRAVVLTVEDEPLINGVLSEILLDAGYMVISTENADEAIEVLQSRNDIRVLVTDVNMPGSMDGLKLAAVVRSKWPPIKIVVTSAAHAASQMPRDYQFVAKPYGQSMVAAVARAAQ